MAKKRYTLRFYKHHDRDLVTFMLTHEFDVVRAVYSSLTAFVNQEIFVIDIPPRTRKDQTEKLKWSYMKVLSLDVEKDQKAIELLDKIHKGAKNNFLKELLRQYLCFPFSEESLENINDYDEISKMFDIFRVGKRIVKAGKTDEQLEKINSQKIKSPTKSELNSIKETGQHNKTEDELNSQKTDNESSLEDKGELVQNDGSQDMSKDDLFDIFQGVL